MVNVLRKYCRVFYRDIDVKSDRPALMVTQSRVHWFDECVYFCLQYEEIVQAPVYINVCVIS